jgi:DNA-binding CsgD family transcriptional regulator
MAGERAAHQGARNGLIGQKVPFAPGRAARSLAPGGCEHALRRPQLAYRSSWWLWPSSQGERTGTSGSPLLRRADARGRAEPPQRRQTAQEQSNRNSARPARCNDGQSSQTLLTQREQQIANLVAAGLSNKQIAREGSIAERTVKAHLHNAYQKLSVSNRTSLGVIRAV